MTLYNEYGRKITEDDWRKPVSNLYLREHIKINPYRIEAWCKMCGYEPEYPDDLVCFNHWPIKNEPMMYPKRCPQCLENEFIEFIYTASLIPSD